MKPYKFDLRNRPYKNTTITFVENNKKLIKTVVEAGYESQQCRDLIKMIRQLGIYSPATATPDIWRSVKRLYLGLNKNKNLTNNINL